MADFDGGARYSQHDSQAAAFCQLDPGSGIRAELEPAWQAASL